RAREEFSLSSERRGREAPSKRYPCSSSFGFPLGSLLPILLAVLCALPFAPCRSLLHPFDQVLSDSQRVRHDRQRRVHCAAGAEKAAVDDIEIVEIMRFAVDIKGACPGIVTEAHRADLVSDARQRNSLANKQIAREQPFVALVAVYCAFGLLSHEFLQLGDKPLVT